MNIYINSLVKVFCFLAILILAGCANRYAMMSKDYNECGYKKTEFNKFSSCIKEKHKLPQKGDPKYSHIYKNRKPSDPLLEAFLRDLNAIEDSKKSRQYCYKRFDGLVSEYQVKEQKENEQAQAIAAVVLVGAAAVAACQDGGCGGSGGGSNQTYYSDPSINSLHPCDYPWQYDSAGRQCGNRAASVRSGGRLGGYR